MQFQPMKVLNQDLIIISKYYIFVINIKNNQNTQINVQLFHLYMVNMLKQYRIFCQLLSLLNKYLFFINVKITATCFKWTYYMF
jgi:hypothetical protein